MRANASNAKNIRTSPATPANAPHTKPNCTSWFHSACHFSELLTPHPQSETPPPTQTPLRLSSPRCPQSLVAPSRKRPRRTRSGAVFVLSAFNARLCRQLAESIHRAFTQAVAGRVVPCHTVPHSHSAISVNAAGVCADASAESLHSHSNEFAAHRRISQICCLCFATPQSRRPYPTLSAHCVNTIQTIFYFFYHSTP